MFPVLNRPDQNEMRHRTTRTKGTTPARPPNLSGDASAQKRIDPEHFASLSAGCALLLKLRNRNVDWNNKRSTN